MFKVQDSSAAINRGGVFKWLLFRIRIFYILIFYSVLLLGVKVNSIIGVVVSGSVPLSVVNADSKKQSAVNNKDQTNNRKADANSISIEGLNVDQYRAIKSIMDKRKELIQRENSIHGKEDVLRVLSKNIDDKIAELRNTQNEVQKLINNIEEKENTNIARLVKMTESMKPRDASRMLEDIEFPILLEIMEKLKEKKASAILSQMDSKKAAYLITTLAKRKKHFKK